MQLLNEEIIGETALIEKESSGLPDGVLLRVTYPICNLGKRNHNNRVYTREVWEKVLANQDLQMKLEKRNLFGHAEHPKTVQSSVEKVSHVIPKFWIDEGVVKQTFEVLDTPYGRIINTLLRANCNVGVSTRAEGDLYEAEDKDGKFMSVVPDKYRYTTTDFTADPSTFGVYPETLERSLVPLIKQGIESHKLDRQFAASMLEGMQLNEAKELLKEMTVEKKTLVECSLEELADYIKKNWIDLMSKSDIKELVVLEHVKLISESRKDRVEEAVSKADLEEKIEELGEQLVSMQSVLDSAVLMGKNYTDVNLEVAQVEFGKKFMAEAEVKVKTKIKEISDVFEMRIKSISEDSDKKKTELSNKLRVLEARKNVFVDKVKALSEEIGKFDQKVLEAYKKHRIKILGKAGSKKLVKLEACSSFEEVDRLLEDIVEGIRDGVAYTPISEIVVQKQPGHFSGLYTEVSGLLEAMSG